MAEDSTEKSANANRTEHHSALAVGLMIGRYKITSVLGQGGFGITYLCQDTQLHRDVAIKEYLPSSLAVRQDGTTVLPRSTEMSKDFVWGRSRFLDEARTMARLGHAPAVVRVHDFLEAHGTAYVVMQLLDGETLEQRLKRETRLSQAAVERILTPLLDGLEQIHTVGFLHRDIKPANIMLARDGSPTLIDFGASRASVAGRSQAMTAVFTPGYAAPEQSTSGKQGPWTDIYSLAATLYTCISGKPPPSVMDRVFESASASSLEAAGRDYSQNLLVAIDAGLQLQAPARPQSIQAWRQVLETGIWNPPAGSAQSGPVTHVIARPAEVETPKAQAEVEAPMPAALPVAMAGAATQASRRPVMLAAAAALALVVAGGSYAIFSPSPAPTPPFPPMPPTSLAAAPSTSTTSAASGPTVSAAPVPPAASPSRTASPPASPAASPSSGTAVATPPPLPPVADTSREQEAAAQRRALDEQRLAQEAAAKAAADEKARAEAAAQRRAVEEQRLAQEAAAKAAADDKARAEAAPKVDEAAKREAEHAEAELRLTSRDRQKIQVALAAVGFDVAGIDGALGPRSRQMIAAWQSKRGEPATGYLTATQNAALLADGGPAIGRWEEAQRRAFADEQRRQQQSPQPQRQRAQQQPTRTWRWPWE